MATLIIPDTFLVSIKGNSSGLPNVSVLGISTPGGTSSAVAAAVKTAWEAAGGPLSQRPSQYVMESYTVTDLSSASGAVVVLSSAAKGGLTSIDLSTNGTCALIALSSGTRSRSKNGRLYHGPLSESQVQTDGRTVTAANVTSIQAAYQQFSAALDADLYVLSVISRKYQTASAVSFISCGSIIATQRRRIRG